MTIALVTGATGQDGWYLCRRLVEAGAEVHVVARRVPDGAWEPGLVELTDSLPGIVAHEAYLEDPVGLCRVVDEVEPDELYNLAGISSVAASWDQPGLTARVTGAAVADLLHASWLLQERSGREVRFVQASSAEIFGRAAKTPQNESTPIVPVTPYGAAKAYAHGMVAIYRARGLHASAAILFNHESPRRPETFVTRKITRAAARIAAGLESRLVLGNLDAARDWGWADDYVAAMVAAARHPEADDFVVATGEVHTVADFVREAFRRVRIEDWQAYVRVDPALVRPAEATVQVGDPSKARARLGWQPTVTFEGLVSTMVDHDVSLLT